MENVIERGAYWEPWTPKVGDRVIWHYRPECPNACPTNDGVTGVIVAIDRQFVKKGHFYQVRSDRELYLKDGRAHGRLGFAAAAELEPIAPEER